MRGKENYLKPKVIEMGRRDFQVNEAYKNCRTNMMVALTDEPHKAIIVSSAMPKEGKTFVAANLGICFAETGEKILIIDANFRKPGLQRIFETNATGYLEDVLLGKCSEEEAIGKTQYEHLSVIQIGSIPENPTELIGSHEMKQLIERLCKQFAYIFIDTAPLDMVTDTVVLTSFVQNIILVVRQHKTKHKQVHKAMERIAMVRGKVLGAILNDVDLHKREKRKRI